MQKSDSKSKTGCFQKNPVVPLIQVKKSDFFRKSGFFPPVQVKNRIFFRKIRLFPRKASISSGYTHPILVLSGTKTAFGQKHAFSVCPMDFSGQKG